jgi:hypothetical protein
MNKEYTINDLLTIVDDITLISINNNLFIKDKIVKKIDLIKQLSTTTIDILNYNTHKKEGLFKYLNTITQKLSTTKKNYNQLNNKLNIILGNIIHNAYLTSGYQVLLSNIPERADQLYNKTTIDIDAESIYDTIEVYTGSDTVLSVIKINNNTYLAKLKDINDARYVCSIIHNMQIEKNIIKVEMLENLEHCFNEDNIGSDTNTTDTNTTSNIDIDIDSSTYVDTTINNNNNTNTNTKIKLLLETYFELIYNKINSILSYFWTKKNIV